MRVLVLSFTLWALVQAKPETYRETEDFKYHRSSTDEGSKSGYYGAQRGNMGGNYERAHNMDPLAQHQMSGLVRQVDGELGESSNARTGQVFTSANSRGIYGSGNYDLSNLGGRSFAEGTSFGDSASQFSQSHSGYRGQATHSSQSQAHSSQYSGGGHSQSSRYNGYQHGATGQSFQTGDSQSSDFTGTGRHNYGSEISSSRYHSMSGHQEQSGYRVNGETQQSGSGYESDGQTRVRLIGGQHARVILRPGNSVTVPVAVQTYHTAQSNDAAHSSLSSSSYDQKSAADSLSESDHQIAYNPSISPKSYQSSSSYQRTWEKHSQVATPTISAHNNLQNGAQVSGIDSHSRRDYSGYNANAQSSSQSRHQTEYSSQYQGSAAGRHSDEASSSLGLSSNLVGSVDTRPKQYQSSYSYHKSWERQGDPYVIVPSTNDGGDSTSQRLTSTYGHGRQSGQTKTGYSHGCSTHCDE